MITTSDIADILYLRAKELVDCELSREGFVSFGGISSERMVIHSRPLKRGTYWAEGLQEVNYLVPDTYDGYADLARLAGIERFLQKNLTGDGDHDGTFYTFRPEQSQILNHEEMKAHYVNVKILFRALNTTE